jgi:hypothetical protein
MISINSTTQSTNCIKRRSSINEKKLLLKNRIQEMKMRVMDRNKRFHEDDTTTTTTANITSNKRKSITTITNSFNSSDTSSGIIGDDFDGTKSVNFLSSTIIAEQDMTVGREVLNGHEMLNNDRNLNRLKKSLNKLRKFNRKRLSTNETANERRACGCTGGEIFTSTSTNLKSLCHSTLNENEKAFLLTNSVQSSDLEFLNIKSNNFYNYAKNLNFYKDLSQNNFLDDAIVLNDRFNNFGEFKIWYV